MSRLRREKQRPLRGSHLPALMWAVNNTTGPVVELGCGSYSTPFLHWACFLEKRPLVTYENELQFYEYAKMFDADYHRNILVSDWDDADLTPSWSVAFVDHSPGERRATDISRLVHAEYVVVHDAEPHSENLYTLSTVYPLFKYCRRYEQLQVHTVILSNVHPL